MSTYFYLSLFCIKFLNTNSLVPLAILTGNPEILNDEFDADIKIAGSWADEEVRYVLEVPEDYENISNKLQYFL